MEENEINKLESTSVAACAALLGRTFIMSVLKNVTGLSIIENKGNILRADMVEEMVLSDLQKRVVAKEGDETK